MTRSPSDMSKALYEKYILWVPLMSKAGLVYCLTRVACTYKEQVALYAQGRESLYDVNRLRAVAGLPPLTINDQNKKVTWTLHSKHIVGLNPGQPEDDKSNAFDFAIMKDGKIIWDVKVDTNTSGGPDYTEAGHLWESVGGTWGGRWKSPDFPHCQV